jgi:hypothetical protein
MAAASCAWTTSPACTTRSRSRARIRIDGYPAVMMQIYRSRARTPSSWRIARRSGSHCARGIAAAGPGDRAGPGPERGHPPAALRPAQPRGHRRRHRAARAAAVPALRLRAAIIVFATVAFAILITINVIYFGGLTLNLLTLMGLAMGFGLVVDNAIVVLENIYRRRRRGEAPTSRRARRARGRAADPRRNMHHRRRADPVRLPAGRPACLLRAARHRRGLSLVASLFVAFTFIPASARVCSGGSSRAPQCRSWVRPAAPARHSTASGQVGVRTRPSTSSRQARLRTRPCTASARLGAGSALQPGRCCRRCRSPG